MILTRLLPPRIKDSLKVLVGRAQADDSVRRPANVRYRCSVCGHEDVTFKRWPFAGLLELDRNQYMHSIFQEETSNLEHYSCGRCDANDRERLYALYFDRLARQDHGVWKVLDFAPRPPFTAFLRRQPRLQIRTADLFMIGVDDQLDIMNMHQYEDGRFDVFFCSHVLEHVSDDIRAMKELHRVLRPGGWGIVMSPIDLGLQEVYENPVIIDADGRCRHFGQRDHVRLYSKAGFVSRLESVGFVVKQFGIGEFGESTFLQNGIHPRSVLYVVTR